MEDKSKSLAGTLIRGTLFTPCNNTNMQSMQRRTQLNSRHARTVFPIAVPAVVLLRKDAKNPVFSICKDLDHM